MKSRSRYSESLEDYLESIYMFGGINVRSVDIANSLQVSRASVNRAINILMEKNLVSKQPYGDVSLTPIGLEISKKVERKHHIVKQLLVEVLGVEADIADSEACGIEHNISDKTASKIEHYLDKIKKS